jgi:hypothetical protein
MQNADPHVDQDHFGFENLHKNYSNFFVKNVIK